MNPKAMKQQEKERTAAVVATASSTNKVSDSAMPIPPWKRTNRWTKEASVGLSKIKQSTSVKRKMLLECHKSNSNDDQSIRNPLLVGSSNRKNHANSKVPPTFQRRGSSMLICASKKAKIKKDISPRRIPNDRCLSPFVATTVRARSKQATQHSSLVPGWRTMNELHQISLNFKGMTIQYRVLYASKEVKDHNPFAKRKIQPNSLVIQSRFASTTGNSGGCSYLLKDWKLPGGLMRRKAHHISIYRDTRPNFYRQSAPGNAFPVVVLEAGIQKRHADIITRFIQEGESGTTLTMFCADHHLLLPGMEDGDIVVEEMFDSERDATANEAPFDLESVIMDEVANDTKKRKVSAIDALNNRLRFPLNVKRPKTYGAIKWRQHQVLNFIVGHSQCFALVEGVANGTEENSSSPNSKEYIKDLFLNGCLEVLPHRGRLLELPGDVMAGKWTGEVMGPARSGLYRDRLANLADTRLRFRHEEYEVLGPLNLQSECRIHCDEFQPTTDLLVSLFCPTPNREQSMFSQGVLVHDDPIEGKAFVGSISLAAFEGFSCSSDAVASSRDVAEEILRGCRQNADPLSMPFLLPIPGKKTSNYVGGSFLCMMRFKEYYHILIASDGLGTIVGVDIIFTQPITRGRQSDHSSTSEAPEHILTNDILLEHNLRLSELTEKKCLDTVAAKNNNVPSTLASVLKANHDGLEEKRRNADDCSYQNNPVREDSVFSSSSARSKPDFKPTSLATQVTGQGKFTTTTPSNLAVKPPVVTDHRGMVRTMGTIVSRKIIPAFTSASGNLSDFSSVCCENNRFRHKAQPMRFLDKLNGLNREEVLVSPAVDEVSDDGVCFFDALSFTNPAISSPPTTIMGFDQTQVCSPIEQTHRKKSTIIICSRKGVGVRTLLAFLAFLAFPSMQQLPNRYNAKTREYREFKALETSFGLDCGNSFNSEMEESDSLRLAIIWGYMGSWPGLDLFWDGLW